MAKISLSRALTSSVRAAKFRWAFALTCAAALSATLFFAPSAKADSCGAVGERACTIPERVPSCDINLVEAAGSCARPACGAEGARTCSAFERTSIWSGGALPLPLPCDLNLTPSSAGCVRPNCGRLGELVCNSAQRAFKCDVNLVAVNGICTRPMCGRAGEGPCNGVADRRPCDLNLVIRNAVCMTMAQAFDWKSRGVMPQPATPQPTASPATPVATPGALQPSAPVTSTTTLEADTDRSGNDIYGFDLTRPDAALCQAACTMNAQCQAWTYVKPGIQGPAPRCYVKNAAAAPSRNACCTSGAKVVSPLLLNRR